MASYTIVVDHLSCWNAFEPKAAATFNPARKSDEQERALKNVLIDPPPSEPSAYRKIKYDFSLPVVATDEGDLDEFLGVLGSLLDTAKSILPGAAALSGRGALPAAVDLYVHGASTSSTRGTEARSRS